MTLCATRLRNCLFIFTTFLFLVQLAALAAQAQTRITSCGTLINLPGRYVLANDLLNCPQQGVIETSAGAYGNHIVSNVSTGNTRYDLFEGNSDCVNQWHDSLFVTRNRDCIH